jgi:hypothetical protein
LYRRQQGYLFLLSILAFVILSLNPPSFKKAFSKDVICLLKSHVTIFIRQIIELAQISGLGFSIALR